MITKKCEICERDFSVKKYRADTVRFCSRQCGGAWHAKTRLPAVVSKAMAGNQKRAGLKPANAFASGNEPWNKGKKGIHLSPDTEFKKGAESHKKMPIGTVRIRKTKSGVPRAFVKIAQPSVWKLRSVANWESEFGVVPDGYVIHHHDRDTLNDDIENLRCISRAEHLNEHRSEYSAET